MTRLLTVLLLVVPAVLAAQEEPPEFDTSTSRRGVMVGVTGFTGGTWQPSGVEIGLLRQLGQGTATATFVSARLGSFVQDQAVIYGSTTGFFLGLFGGVRAPITTLAEVGTGRNPSAIRIVASLEAGGELNFNSPLPQGKAMGTAAALAGISFGGGGAGLEQGFAVVAGPALFFGKASDLHVQVSLRYQNSW